MEGLDITTNFLIFQIGEELDDVFIFDGEINGGYKFKDIPLTLSVGYRYWWFGKAIKGRYIYDPYFPKKANVQFEDAGHGPGLKIAYSF